MLREYFASSVNLGEVSFFSKNFCVSKKICVWCNLAHLKVYCDRAMSLFDMNFLVVFEDITRVNYQKQDKMDYQWWIIQIALFLQFTLITSLILRFRKIYKLETIKWELYRYRLIYNFSMEFLSFLTARLCQIMRSTSSLSFIYFWWSQFRFMAS